jgi:hypothetical protein
MFKAWFGYLVAVAVLGAAASASASDWSMFRPAGNGVSVSFAAVDRTTYTWKFRNDGDNTIKYMEFTYSYVNAETGLYQTDKDVLPVPLGAAKVFGGWAAFTSTSRRPPAIQITKIQRE